MLDYQVCYVEKLLRELGCITAQLPDFFFHSWKFPVDGLAAGLDEVLKKLESSEVSSGRRVTVTQ